MELTDLTLTEAAAGLAKKKFSAGEYRDAVIGRLERLNDQLNAFLFFESGQARASASKASGDSLFAGIPYAAKDNIVTRGGRTTCASRILENFVSPFDATAISRLRSSGAWLVGKTNLDEFAMGSSTEHSAFGPTRNPWDVTRVAGGSSGGSAAAVAARIVPFALGSETGGSVRQPAAFCGTIGLKPTYGRISRNGLVAFASSLDQIGVFTRSARDCAHVLEVIAGRDSWDSTSSAHPVDKYSDGIDEGVGGLRVGVISGIVESLSDEVRANFEKTLRDLADGGAIIEEVSLEMLQYAIAVYYIVANAEASANLSRFDGVRYGHRSAGHENIKDLYFRSRGEGFGPEVKRRIMLGTFALSSGYYDAYYGRAQKIRGMMGQEIAAAFERFDVLATPTTPTPAFKVGEKVEDPLSMYLSDIFTAPANLVGIPAIAIPSGFTSAGLPLSLQLMGRHFAEKTLFRAAHYVENSAGAADRKPQLGSD